MPAIKKVKQLISCYEKTAQRKAGAVQLLAVSKKQSCAQIRAAYAAGQRLFGENYVQEALKKIHLLSDLNIEWHFIGTIQRNKIRKIAENFAWVHSIPDLNVAQKLNDSRPHHLPPLNCCLEINLASESSKVGSSLAAIGPFLNKVSHLSRLKMRGLMCLPPLHSSIEVKRSFFKQINFEYHKYKQKYHLDTLSMGTSHDFEIAIQEGATLVRLGTRIFGERF